MDYYLVTISISKDENFNEFKRHYYVCQDLKTAIKCANHKAYVYNFKPLNNNELWEGVSDLIKFYDKGRITIEKKQMWQKEWD